MHKAMTCFVCQRCADAPFINFAALAQCRRDPNDNWSALRRKKRESQNISPKIGSEVQVAFEVGFYELIDLHRSRFIR